MISLKSFRCYSIICYLLRLLRDDFFYIVQSYKRQPTRSVIESCQNYCTDMTEILQDNILLVADIVDIEPGL